MKRSKIIKGTYGSMSTPERDIGGWKKVETENLQSTPLEEEVSAAPLVQRVPSEGMWGAQHCARAGRLVVGQAELPTALELMIS